MHVGCLPPRSAELSVNRPTGTLSGAVHHRPASLSKSSCKLDDTVPRIQLTEKSSYSHAYHTTLKVRDINYGGHLGNDAVAGLLHEARLELLRSLGASEGDLGDSATGIILSDLAIRFVAEAYLFDVIVIETEVEELKRTSLRLCHRIRRGADLIALAEVGVVAFVYASRRVGAFPESFVRALRAHSDH